MTIAVSGSTGQLGRLVIAGLRERLPASGIVALARDPDRAADLGVDVRRADYADAPGLVAALQDVATLLLISSSEVGQRVAQHRTVIDAARQAGVGRIVYTSVLRADTSPLGLADEHRQTEAALAASGLRTTILRNGWYTQNYTAAIPAALTHGVLVGSAGQGRIAAATRADYAAAAVAVLTGDGHDGRIYELAGDDAFTLSDLAAEISRRTGRQIPYHDLPQEDYARILKEAGLPAGLATALAGYDADAARGALDHDGHDLSDLIGRPTTTLRDAVAEALNPAA